MTNKILSSLFGGARAAVIGLLFSQPDRTYHFREIVRRTGASVGSVQRELGLLVELGLVERRHVGNLVQYLPNADAPVFPELRRLAEKTHGIEAKVQSALAPLAQDIVFACIFGSVASGMATAQSDVDVLVVGEVTFTDVVRALTFPSEVLGLTMSPTVYSQDEFARRVQEKNHFVGSILGKPFITLFGSPEVPRQPRQSKAPARGAVKSGGAPPAGSRRKARSARQRS